MDLKPLLLARVVKEKTAIILDVQPNEFDIVIMVNGIPQPIRTVSFPSETLSWQKKLPMIKNELNRTIEFYQSNNPEWPLAPDVPVFVSGEIAYESEHLQSISDEVGHPVLPISPPLEYPAGLDPHRYMANIGLVLKKLSFNETGLSVTHLNVLPEVYQPEPISLIRILVVPTAVIAICFVLLLGLLIQNTSSDIAKLHSQLNATNLLLQQKLAQKQKLTDTLADMENKIKQTKTSGGNFAAAVANLEKQSNGLNGDLEVLMNSLPATVSLATVSHSSHTCTMKGRAPDEEEILSYLRELDASGRFSDITINNMRRAPDESIDFTVVLRTGE
jgi:Tfp pilus assembly protein PilN